MNSRISLSILFTLVVISSAFSQETKNTVILINAEAVRAELAKDGEIKAIHGVEKGYLDGFDDVKHPTVFDEQTQVEPIQGYKVVYVPTYEMTFKANHAILNKAIISQLEGIVRELKNDLAKQVMVTAPISGNERLDSNRKKAILSFLHIHGISLNRMIEERSSDVQKDIVEVNIVK